MNELSTTADLRSSSQIRREKVTHAQFPGLEIKCLMPSDALRYYAREAKDPKDDSLVDPDLPKENTRVTLLDFRG